MQRASALHGPAQLVGEVRQEEWAWRSEPYCYLVVWLRAASTFSTKDDHQKFKKKISVAQMREYAPSIGALPERPAPDGGIA